VAGSGLKGDHSGMDFFYIQSMKMDYSQPVTGLLEGPQVFNLDSKLLHFLFFGLGNRLDVFLQIITEKKLR